MGVRVCVVSGDSQWGQKSLGTGKERGKAGDRKMLGMLGTEKENRRQGAGFSYGSGGWDGGAVASIGPLAAAEEGAGKAGRAQDIGGDVTEGEAAIMGQEQGLQQFDEDAVGGDGHEGEEGGLAMTTAGVRGPAD